MSSPYRSWLPRLTWCFSQVASSSPRARVLGYAALGTLAALGLPLSLRADQLPAAKTSFAALFVASCFTGIVVYNLTYSQPQGRFLFPVLGHIAVFLTAGLRALLGPRPLRRVAPTAGGALVAALVLVDLLSLATVVQFYSGAG